MAALAAEHVFYGENTSGVGGDMSSVAHQAAIMVGHAAMPPERVPMPATMTRSQEEAARKRLDDYFLDTGGKLLAVASLSDHYAEALTRPDKRQLAARIVGHAYLVAYKFAEQEQGCDLACRGRTGGAPRVERRRDHRAGELAPPEACGRRLPGGMHVAAPVSPETPAVAAVPKVHRRRFMFLYVALAVLLAAGAAFGVHLATRTIVTPKPWASWAPIKSSPEAKVREIANHVQNLYVAPGGKDLTTVRGGPLSVGSDPAVLVKPDASATATGGYKFFDGPSVEYQLCGNTTKGNCAIDQKKVTPNASGALTRRMAYELALTTFHYVPEVKNVAVLLPAVVKGQKARMLVIERADFKDPKSLAAGLVPIRREGRAERRHAEQQPGHQDRQGHGPADLPLRGHGDQRQPARLPDLRRS